MSTHAELRERLERCAETCEMYSPDQCATLIDGIGWLAMRKLLRDAAAALAREEAPQAEEVIVASPSTQQPRWFFVADWDGRHFVTRDPIGPLATTDSAPPPRNFRHYDSNGKLVSVDARGIPACSLTPALADSAQPQGEAAGVDGWIERAARCAEDMLRGPLADVPAEERSCNGIQHVAWMCMKLAAKDVGSETKTCRWLGYAQGALVSLGYSTLETEKRRNLNSAAPTAGEETNRATPDDSRQDRAMSRALDAARASLSPEHVAALTEAVAGYVPQPGRTVDRSAAEASLAACRAASFADRVLSEFHKITAQHNDDIWPPEAHRRMRVEAMQKAIAIAMRQEATHADPA